jgi:hypothetical protein
MMNWAVRPRLTGEMPGRRGNGERTRRLPADVHHPGACAALVVNSHDIPAMAEHGPLLLMRGAEYANCRNGATLCAPYSFMDW